MMNPLAAINKMDVASSTPQPKEHRPTLCDNSRIALYIRHTDKYKPTLSKLCVCFNQFFERKLKPEMPY